LIGAVAALVALALVVALGISLTHTPIDILHLDVGALLLTFGLQ
jgi:uncharacterized membrane protein